MPPGATPTKLPVGRILAAIAILVAIACIVLSTDPVIRIAGISGASIVLFATRALPEVVTASATFLAFLAIAAAPNEVIFSGFATGGFWLLFAGLIIGAAIASTGLGRQIALRIFQRTGTSYKRAVLFLAGAGVLLGLFVPSAIPRVIVLLPITLSLAEAMGFRPGSRGCIGLAMTASVSTLMPTYFFLTANLPVIVQMGALETLYGESSTFTGFFLYQWPTNLVRFLMLLALLLPFATAKGTEPQEDAGVESPAPLNAAQMRLLAILLIAVGFWATDFVHGIAPAWVALTTAAILMIPMLGIVEPTAMKTQIDLSPIFFIAAVFCVSAVATTSGLSQTIADALIPRLGLGEGGSLRDLYAVTGFSMVISHLTTAPATPVVLAPLAGPMAEATGWPLETVSMAQVIAIGTTVLPYQAPPLVVALALAKIPIAALTRICVLMALATLGIGLPLTWAWWQAMGYFAGG